MQLFRFLFWLCKKKVEGGGGWVDILARHRPINRLCISVGSVLQRWWYWWWGVARMV